MSCLWNVSPDDQAAWKAMISREENSWVVSRCINISPCYMFITPWVRKRDKSWDFNHTAACLSSPEEYKNGCTSNTNTKWRADKGGNHWAPQSLIAPSLLRFEMLNHTCTSICFWFVPSLSLPASYSPLLFPFSVLPAFLCVRGQTSGRGWARTGSRDRPGNASVRSSIESRFREKGKTPGRRCVRGGCWVGLLWHPDLSHNINPLNTLKQLLVLIKLKWRPTPHKKMIYLFLYSTNLKNAV